MSKQNKSTRNSVVLVTAIAISSALSGAVQANPEKLTGSQVLSLQNNISSPSSSETLSTKPKDSDVIRAVNETSLDDNQALTAQNVTSVSQLSDVKPTDWAFTALQSLVERYGCIAGYPDRTYRGQRALTRYEFAAGLNACLDKINELISSGLADKVSKSDLAALQKLQEEFAAELAALRGRVDALEAKTAKLEAQQFSTTTKLSGEAIFTVAGGTGGPKDGRTNVIFSDRVRLVLNTSFTGKDLLRTRLEAGNFFGSTSDTSSIASVLGTNSARPGYASGTSTTANNSFNLNLLFYRFPAFDNKVTFFIGPVAAPDDFFTQITPLAPSGQASISRFGRFDPFFRIGGTSSLLGVDYKFSDKVALQVGYSASNAADATPGGSGLFGGTTTIAAQLLFKVASNLDASLAYANTYLQSNSLGTGLTSTESISGAGTGPIRTDLISGTLVWKITPGVTFNTSGTVIFANSVNLNASTTFTSWLVGLTFNDLFKEGSTGAIVFGQPLKRNSVGGLATFGNSPNTPTGIIRPINSTAYHLEVFYRYQASKNISITPGVYWIFNPEGASGNPTAMVGLLRTTFSF